MRRRPPRSTPTDTLVPCSPLFRADADEFAGDLLIAADDALGAAEMHHDMAEFDRLDDAGDYLTHAVLEFLMLALALGVADLLEDHLLGRLGVDAAQGDRRPRVDDEEIGRAHV